MSSGGLRSNLLLSLVGSESWLVGQDCVLKTGPMSGISCENILSHGEGG